jgi:glycosyltransferase involved in cell wall biosynthesis
MRVSTTGGVSGARQLIEYDPRKDDVRIWVITVGEPLPGLSAGARPWRSGLLCRLLAQRGHQVVWWTSDVDHFSKRYFDRSADRYMADDVVIQFLHGRLYRRNVSLARFLNHREIARAFASLAQHEPPPDVIICSFPTIELSEEAVRYGRSRAVPVVLDVRDLWPDVFMDYLPAITRMPARVLLRGSFAAARRALAGCSGIVAVSEGYLQWGLQRAGRARGENDRVFPLAYDLPAAGADGALRERLQTLGVDASKRLCVFVGTFGRSYDLGPVLEVARGLSVEGDGRFQFVLAGAGERLAEWQRRASGLPNVVFTGWLDQPGVHSLIRAAHVGLGAYTAGAPQGIPNKIIEYMAAGAPVLSSLRGETEALLARERCGITFDVADPYTLRAALEQVGTGANRETMGQAARRVFEGSYKAENVYAALAAHLEGLRV